MGLTLNGKKVLDRTLLRGQEFILDADGDSSLTADTDDQLDLRLGGTDIFVFKTTGLDIGAVTNAILVSGTTTSAFKIDANATTGLEITSSCSPTDGIIIAGSTARGINISGAASSAQLHIGGTDILANGEQAIYVNCPSEDGATNAAWFTLGSTVTSGDVTGLRSRVTGNAASGGANIRGAYTEAFCGASKHVATLQGLLAHASVAAGTCTVATTQVIYGIFGTGDSFTGTDVYVGYLKAQTRGTETIGGNYCLLGLENEAVGGAGKQMDSAIRIFATNVSTPHAFGYGIDLSGAAGEIATADIKLSDGSVINDSNGRWGIGTTGPNATLEVRDTTQQLRLAYNASNYASFTVESDGKLTIQTTGTDEDIVIGTGSFNNAITIDDSVGKVGIGVWPPAWQLDVSQSSVGGDVRIEIHNEDTANAASDAGIVARSGGADAGDPFFGFVVQGETAWTLGVDNDDSDKFAISQSGTIAVGAGQKLIITTAGRVGIGTTEPSKLLHLAKTNLDAVIRLERIDASVAGGQDIAAIEVSGGESTPDVVVAKILVEAEAAWTDTSSPSRMSFWTTPAAAVLNLERMRIDKDGNVGIGTVGPGAKLEVYTDTTGEYIAVFDQDHTGGYGVRINVDGTSNVSALIVVSGATNYLFRVDQDGQVGIGTGSPGQILDVNQGSGNMIADGYDTHSERRFKKNIIELATGDYAAIFDQLDALKLYRYQLKHDHKGRQHLGILADDPATPSILKGASDKYQSLSLGDIIMFLVATVKGLNHRVKILEGGI